MKNSPKILTPNLVIHAGQVTTTSLDLAQNFGKAHKDVLRAIDKLDCSKKFSGRNFAPAEYKDEQGKPRPMFEITRDGFSILAMGFTGKRAMAFKERYIEAFNIMERELVRLKARPNVARMADWDAVLGMISKAQHTDSPYTQALYLMGFTPSGDVPPEYRSFPPKVVDRLIQLARKANDWARAILSKWMDLDVKALPQEVS